MEEKEPDEPEEDGDDESDCNDRFDELRRILKKRQCDTTEFIERGEEAYCKDAAALAGRGAYTGAINLCEEGLEYFPNSGAILSDVIHYSIARGMLETAKYFYEELTGRIPRRRFQTRNYAAAAAYLLTAAAGHEKELRELLSDWRCALPYDELSWFWEGKLEEALGHYEQSVEVLEGAVAALPNASHCALRLGKEQMARGLYEAVIQTADYGLSAVEMETPGIKAPQSSAFSYLRTRAEDALLHQMAAVGGAVCRKDVERLAGEYRLLRGTAALRGHHGWLADRVRCLELLLLRLPEETP